MSKVELVDTHAHLNFSAFRNDADQVIKRCLDNDVWVINVGSQLETSQRAVGLAEKYPEGVYAAIGLHPIHATGHLMKNKLDPSTSLRINPEPVERVDPEELADQEKIGEFKIDDYRKLASRLIGDPPKRRVVAIGEIGLDYYYRPKTKARLEEFQRLQREALAAQLSLAKELGLPVIFHCRSAHDDLIETLNTGYKIPDTKTQLRGVIHCFTGNQSQAEQYLNSGLYLGFTGIIFRQIPGIDWSEIIKAVPLEKILVETDSPYLKPPISENQRLDQRESVNLRNEPLFVKEVVKEIARIKNLSYQEVSEITTKNARKLFNL